jgi:type IV pilus assembly protein PilB
MQRIQKKLGEILISKGLITSVQLTMALAQQSVSKEYLGRILIKNGVITEHNLMMVLSEQFAIPIVQLKPKDVDWEFVRTFSPSMVLDHRCLPLRRDEWTVTVAITNPLDMWVMKLADDCCRGLKLKLVLVSEAEMDNATYVFKQYLKQSINDLFKE